MTHVLHVCPKVDPSYMEALRLHHGWERKERPLIVDISRTTGESRHETCPDCGEPTEKMERASALDVSLLNVNLLASGSRNRPAQQYKQENVGLQKALREISERLANLEGKKDKGGKA